MPVDRPKRVADCYRRAEECRQRAAETTDPTMRDDFLEMKFRWLLSAQSYEFAQHIAALDKTRD